MNILSNFQNFFRTYSPLHLANRNEKAIFFPWEFSCERIRNYMQHRHILKTPCKHCPRKKMLQIYQLANEWNTPKLSQHNIQNEKKMKSFIHIGHNLYQTRCNVKKHILAEWLIYDSIVMCVCVCVFYLVWCLFLCGSLSYDAL